MEWNFKLSDLYLLGIPINTEIPAGMAYFFFSKSGDLLGLLIQNWMLSDLTTVPS